MEYYFSTSVHSCLEQIENLYSASRPSHVVLSRFWISMEKFTMSWMILSKNNLRVSHRKQINDPSDVRLATSLMNFEFQPCGIFEGLSHHHDEVVTPNTFADSAELGDMIKKSVSS